MDYLSNRLLKTDSYKFSHYKQYPDGTEKVVSYVESRGGKFNETVMYGVRNLLNILERPITAREVNQAYNLSKLHGVPFNYEGFNYIVNELSGHLPLKMYSVLEGEVVPNKNIIMRVENTDPKCFWLTSYIETIILRYIWYPTTVATQSYNLGKLIGSYLEKTGTPETLPFKMHDFGGRGVSSSETAALGGSAHLITFSGTDTVDGISYILDNYEVEPDYMPGFSIPASEHSTITSWGKEGEYAAFENMLDQFGDDFPIIACVSDSYNIWDAIHAWKKLESKIIEKGCTLVIRPDSGDPVQTPVMVVENCLKEFGYTINDKGYKVLPDHIRVIQGDGVCYESIESILSILEECNISADNITFGSGGALLQKLDRDTLKFAMKCCGIVQNGKWVDVFKEPITDAGKRSKAGNLELFTKNGEYVTMDVNNCKPNDDWKTAMQLIFENGKILYQPESFEAVRERVKK